MTPLWRARVPAGLWPEGLCPTLDAYTVGQKSKLLILSECQMSKLRRQEEREQIRTATEKILSDIFTCFVFKYSDRKQSVKLLLGKHELA